MRRETQQRIRANKLRRSWRVTRKQSASMVMSWPWSELRLRWWEHQKRFIEMARRTKRHHRLVAELKKENVK